jgi:hypothetical protein
MASWQTHPGAVGRESKPDDPHTSTHQESAQNALSIKKLATYEVHCRIKDAGLHESTEAGLYLTIQSHVCLPGKETAPRHQLD